ncbi:MAG: cytochrome c [Saprospiraceae bacterium]|nr:cytochrome c [Saprospiraceae bacterium]
MRFLLFFLLILSFLWQACQQDGVAALAEWRKRYAPLPQRLLVPTGRDTSITCQNGTILHFCKNTFLTSAGSVALDVQEVTNRAEMVALRLNTQMSSGLILESEGMLNIQPVDAAGLRINPDCPIRVEFPARGVPGYPWLFEGQDSSGVLRWENPQRLDQDSLIRGVEKGKRLFCWYCAACHSQNLDEALTGPALGNIQQYRELDWLVRFTKNSSRMIAAGDPLAVALWNRYKPVIMPDAEFLSNEDVQSIYRWIAEESKRQGAKNQPPDQTSTARDSINALKVVQNTLMCLQYYKFPYTTFQWRNIDVFVDNYPEVGLQVQVQNASEFEELNVVLVYETRKLVIDLSPSGRSNFTLHPYPQARLPQEPVLLMAFGVKGRQLFSTELHTRISAENNFVLTLKPEKQEAIDALFEFLKPPPGPGRNGCNMNTETR